MKDIHSRILLLEQKFDVMTKEFSGVLQEMQVTIQGTVGMTKTAVRALHDRLTAIEQKLGLLPIPEDREGRDL